MLWQSYIAGDGGLRQENVASSSPHYAAPAEDGHQRTTQKPLPALRGTPTDVPHVPKLLATRTYTLITSSLSLIPLRDSRHGTTSLLVYLWKSTVSEPFARPVTPKLLPSKETSVAKG